MEKICPKCKISKVITEFGKRNQPSDTCLSCKREWAKIHYNKNKENILSSRVNHKEDKIKKRERLRNWENNKLKSDPKFLIIKRLRRRHWGYLKGQLSTTENLGCSKEQFKEYIENLFQEGMTWDNYGFGKGKWCIDHVLPLASLEINSSGKLIENEYNLSLFNYKNMQPMWFIENMKKSDFIDNERARIKPFVSPVRA